MKSMPKRAKHRKWHKGTIRGNATRGHTVEFLVWTAMVGGALTLAILIVRQRVSPALAVRFSWLFRLHDPSSGVPYGLAIAAAALIVYPDTVWVGFVAG